jgi:signal peptidase
MQLLFRIFYTLFGVVVAALVVLLIASMVPVLGFQVRIVTSGSMEPAIKTGSMVVLHDTADYQDGDVITYFERGKEQLPTTHRIVGSQLIAGQVEYLTKGDANEDIDNRTVNPSTIVGEVVAAVPGVGYLLAFARTWYGALLLVGLPLLLFVIEEGQKIVTVAREQKS